MSTFEWKNFEITLQYLSMLWQLLKNSSKQRALMTISILSNLAAFERKH